MIFAESTKVVKLFQYQMLILYFFLVSSFSCSIVHLLPTYWLHWKQTVNMCGWLLYLIYFYFFYSETTCVLYNLLESDNGLSVIYKCWWYFFFPFSTSSLVLLAKNCKMSFNSFQVKMSFQWIFFFLKSSFYFIHLKLG